jgi:hypothetical protein
MPEGHPLNTARFHFTYAHASRPAASARSGGSDTTETSAPTRLEVKKATTVGAPCLSPKSVFLPGIWTRSASNWL